MTNKERQNWIISIENTSAFVESYLGSAVVQSVLERFGAHSIEELNPSDLPESSVNCTQSKLTSTKANRPEQDEKLLTARHRIT